MYEAASLTASKTLTRSDANRVNVINAAAGLTLTLPAATGTGDIYKFLVGTTVTSNSVVIQVADADTTMTGLAISAADGGNSVNGWETAATSDTITLNGSTTGGILGDHIELIDVAADTWSVVMHSSSTGTEATPFSAAVS
jgi:hypothetical protein